MSEAIKFERRLLSDLAPQNAFNLTGKTAVVTGAAGGIGRWLAAGLAANGARLALVDLDRYGLEGVGKELTDCGVDLCCYNVDLRTTDTDALIARICDDLACGNIDILVNAAGVNRRRRISEITQVDFDEIIAVNLRAPFFLTQAAVRRMDDRGGSIVHIGSINSAYGLADVSVYGAAKAALAQLTRVQAVEWAPMGIRVNCLAPGFMRTPLTEPLWRDPEINDWILSRVPLGRPGHPKELVGQLLVLVSDAGSFITGQTYVLDGGFLAGGNWRIASGSEPHGQ